MRTYRVVDVNGELVTTMDAEEAEGYVEAGKLVQRGDGRRRRYELTSGKTVQDYRGIRHRGNETTYAEHFAPGPNGTVNSRVDLKFVDQYGRFYRPPRSMGFRGGRGGERERRRVDAGF